MVASHIGFGEAAPSFLHQCYSGLRFGVKINGTDVLVPWCFLGWFWKGVNIRRTERLFSTTRSLALSRGHCCRSEVGLFSCYQEPLLNVLDFSCSTSSWVISQDSLWASTQFGEGALCGFMGWTFLIWHSEICAKPSSNPLQKAQLFCINRSGMDTRSSLCVCMQD